MNAAHVDDVRRDRPRRFGDVMTVLKDNRRVDLRGRVVRSRVRIDHHGPVVSEPEHVVRPKGRVVEPLDERSGHGVRGEQMRHARRVGRVPGEFAFGVRDHRRRYQIDDRHVQLGRDVRHTVVRQRLHHEHVETLVRPALQHVSEPTVPVGQVAEQSVVPVQLGHGLERAAEYVQQRHQVLVDLEHVIVGRVHHRQVGHRRRRPVAALVERREHGHVVSGSSQRPQHRAHEVPMALGPDRFHGQYLRAVHRHRPTVQAHRRQRQQNAGRTRHVRRAYRAAHVSAAVERQTRLGRNESFTRQRSNYPGLPVRAPPTTVRFHLCETARHSIRFT